jgi:hypothetical protein
MTEPRKPIQRMIAQAMANAINHDSLFAPILRAEQVADPKRRLQELREGEMIVDCIGQGARFEPRNRRDGNRTYIVWVAVHMKLRDGQVTNDALDESGYWAQQVQEFFHDPDNSEVLLENQQRAVLTGSEPFPLSREALFGHGLHMSTYSFNWEMVR